MENINLPNFCFYPSGMSPRSIDRMSKAAAENMGYAGNVFLPISDSEIGNKTKLEEMGIIFGKRKDNVLICATLPTGWKIIPTEKDPRHRKLIDVDGNIKVRIFLKDTSYDYYGHVSVN